MKTSSWILAIILLCNFAFSQDMSILPAQKDAILVLSAQNGFTNASLDQWLTAVYKTDLNGLSQTTPER